MLVNVDTTSLKCSPTHLCVQSKEAKSRMLGKPPINIHHQMFEVVTNSNLIAPLAKESAAPVGNNVGKDTEKYPSVLNSLMGAPPIVGHMRIAELEPVCRSWTA